MNIGGAAPVPCVSGVQVCDFQGNTYMKHGDVQRASVADFATAQRQLSESSKVTIGRIQAVVWASKLPCRVVRAIRTPPVIFTGPSDT